MQNYIQSLQQLHLKLENVACWTIGTRVSRNLENWVVWGQILPLIWYRSAWSCLVLVRNDQKKNFQTQGVPATGDRACAPWLRQHSVNTFFLEHPYRPKDVYSNQCWNEGKRIHKIQFLWQISFCTLQISELCQNKTPHKKKTLVGNIILQISTWISPPLAMTDAMLFPYRGLDKEYNTEMACHPP